MRYTASPEQLKFFNLQGYLQIDDLLNSEESKALLSSIKSIGQKSPGYPEENLFRSIPLILSLAIKKGWGQLAAELIHKKPLRLAYDKFSTSFPQLSEPIDEQSCGLLIELKLKSGVFFRNALLIKELYNSPESCYLLLIVTAKYLPEERYPIIFK